MYKNILRLIILVVIGTFSSSILAAEKVKIDNDARDILGQKLVLEISNAWARKSMSPNNNSAAYMTISNPTDQQITIIGASAPMAANNVELHESFVDEQGISRMTSIDKIVVPANSKIELKPGGIHIMLLDLKRNLSPGDSVVLDIKAENMDLIPVMATVR